MVHITKPEVLETQGVKLTCNFTCKPSDNATVIWRKNGKDLTTDQTTNNELMFQNVSTDDKGNYSCALKGHEGHPSKPVNLNVMCEFKTKSLIRQAPTVAHRIS